MPLCGVCTNVKRQDIPENFSEKLVKVISVTLDKPPERVSISIVPDCILNVQGTSEPCAQLTLTSVGKLGEEENGKHVAAINACVSEQLKVPIDRVLIHFFDAKAFEVGVGLKTFSQILAEKETPHD